MSNPQTDSPTHRLHILQQTLKEAEDWLAGIRLRRAAIVEKVKKAKENSKLAQELKTHKQLQRINKKLERLQYNIESDIDMYADELNKARALFYELSDGEVMLPKETIQHGDEVSKTD